MSFKSIILFLYFIILPGNVLGTGVAFLKIDVGAKPAAMGGAYTALADDVTAIYWNPAGLAQLNQTELNVMHNDWFSGINYEFLALAYPTENLTFATSLIYLYTDEIKEVLKDTKKGGYWETGKVFSAESIALSFALAQPLQRNLFMGANLKYIYESIEKESASGGAVDLGILFKHSNGLRFGFVVQNLGPNMKFITDEFALPVTYRAGIAYQIEDRFRFSLDVKKVKGERLNLCAGIESWFGKLFALRFSGVTQGDNKLGKFRGLPTGIAVGCGFNITNSVALDYAYVPYGDLGDTHRISMSMKFGQKRIPSTPKSTPKKEEVYKLEPEDIESTDTKSKFTEKHFREKKRLIGWVNMENVSIWQGPGLNYPKIATVSKGTELLILDTSKKWYYKVKLKDGTIGWICSKFVEW